MAPEEDEVCLLLAMGLNLWDIDQFFCGRREKVHQKIEKTQEYFLKLRGLWSDE